MIELPLDSARSWPAHWVLLALMALTLAAVGLHAGWEGLAGGWHRWMLRRHHRRAGRMETDCPSERAEPGLGGRRPSGRREPGGSPVPTEGSTPNERSANSIILRGG